MSSVSSVVRNWIPLLAISLFLGCQQQAPVEEAESNPAEVDQPQAVEADATQPATSDSATDAPPVGSDIFRAPLESELPEQQETSFLILDDGPETTVR